jgi:signal transduction histidine kinase
MTDHYRTVQIVCGDWELARRYAHELERSVHVSDLVLLPSASEARRSGARTAPLATLLDESAVEAGVSMEASSAPLCERAPLVVIASAERQAELDALTTSGWLDFVPRSGDFIQVAAGLLGRRVQAANLPNEFGAMQRELFANFGELLRHEVNNPLTGILGNAELLLVRKENLPPLTVERLETIAELAVRLRETVRRLSHAWEERREERPSA